MQGDLDERGAQFCLVCRQAQTVVCAKHVYRLDLREAAVRRPERGAESKKRFCALMPSYSRDRLRGEARRPGAVQLVAGSGEGQTSHLFVRGSLLL